jgi:hypothetical protein
MSVKSGRARIAVEWGYATHEVVLSPSDWSLVKRGGALQIKSRGFNDEGGFQWEYWSFSGGLEGDLIVEYGDEGGTGFNGTLDDAMIEEIP